MERLKVTVGSIPSGTLAMMIPISNKTACCLYPESSNVHVNLAGTHILRLELTNLGLHCNQVFKDCSLLNICQQPTQSKGKSIVLLNQLSLHKQMDLPMAKAAMVPMSPRKIATLLICLTKCLISLAMGVGSGFSFEVSPAIRPISVLSPMLNAMPRATPSGREKAKAQSQFLYYK